MFRWVQTRDMWVTIKTSYPLDGAVGKNLRSVDDKWISDLPGGAGVKLRTYGLLEGE